MEVSKIGKILMSTILIAALVLTSFTMDETLAAEKTVAGKTNYTVVTDEMYGMLVTKEPVDLTVGSKYFLTYTVESVEKNTLLGLGLLVTKDYTAAGVYGDNGEGFMKYTDFNQELNTLLEPGYTYFVSYEVKEDGFHYRIARAKGDESEYVNIGDVGEGVIGKEITDGKYFGLMFNGAEEYQGEKRCLSATLTRVRCYDAKGNDIALTTKGTGAATVYQPSKFTEKTVPHYYEFSLTDAKNVCISNKKQATTDTIYMSFDVVNVKRNAVAMNGYTLCMEPTEEYPWSHGIIGYQDYPLGESPWLVEGAHYFVVFEKTQEGASATVKRTVNGKSEIFGWTDGLFMENFDYDKLNYFGIFMGQGDESFVSADYKNFRCYDANGNNLAVQVNKSDVEVVHYGNLEDYSLCAAVYYCKDNQTFLILDDEENFASQGVDTAATWGTYEVDDNSWVLTAKLNGNEYQYQYKHSLMVDGDGNEYKRMKDNKVTFITGSEDICQTATAENMYRIDKPDDPVKKDNTFKCWCLGDGTEYDFDTVVTEATTLYAKWVDGDGNEYLAVSSETAPQDMSAYIAVGASVVVLAVAASIVILILRKKKEA